MYSSEIVKLVYLLQKMMIPFVIDKIWGGWIIKVKVGERPGDIIDAVCHQYSHGGKSGLLEIMGGLTAQEEESSSVLGWLCAEEVARRFKWCYEHKSMTYIEDKTVRPRREKEIFMADYDSLKDIWIDVEQYKDEGYTVFVYNEQGKLIHVEAVVD